MSLCLPCLMTNNMHTYKHPTSCHHSLQLAISNIYVRFVQHRHAGLSQETNQDLWANAVQPGLKQACSLACKRDKFLLSGSISAQCACTSVLEPLHTQLIKCCTAC